MLMIAPNYAARHIATRYWKDTTTHSADLSKALIVAAFKHVDVLKGINPNRVYKFKVALHYASDGKVGQKVPSSPYCFVYHKGVMTVQCGHLSPIVTRC